MLTAEPRRSRAGKLLRDIGAAAAIGIEDFRGRALCEHVLCRRQCRWNGMAMDIDKAGRDVETRDVKIQRRLAGGEIADFCYVAVPDG